MRLRSFKCSPLPAAAAGFAAVLILATAGRPSARGQDSPATGDQLAALKSEGQEVYARDCSSCHGADGTGDGAGPALDGNTNLGNKDHVLKRILEGSPENGMDPFGKALSDHEIAAAATFVRTAWNNTYGVVTDADVKMARGASSTRP